MYSRSTFERAAGRLLVAVSLAAGVGHAHAQDIEVFRAQSLDAPQPQSALNGVYVLTMLGNAAPPVKTPSQYGTITRGAMVVRGSTYVLAYEYGNGERLTINGTLSYDQQTRQVTFRPATSGVAGSVATQEGKDLVSVIDGAFGMRNARIVFTWAQPLPDEVGQQTGTAQPGGADSRTQAPQVVTAQEPQVVRAQEPQMVRAQEPQIVQPQQPQTVRPGQPDQPPELQSPRPSACPVVQGGNLVEPLSNGLALAWPLGDIREKFGEGTPSWDRRTVTYENFRVAVGGAAEKIWHFHITGPGVCLSSGISYGSTKAEVQRVFGRAYEATHGQYKLTFEYDGDRVIDIGVDPAEGEFSAVTAPSRKSAQSLPAGNPPAKSDPPARSNPPAKTPPSKAPDASVILGTWWGVQSTTQIEVKADGTYSSPNGGEGTWRMNGRDLVFTGALAGWNNGRAKLTEGGWIEFLWKDASGAAYLFQLVRR